MRSVALKLVSCHNTVEIPPFFSETFRIAECFVPDCLMFPRNSAPSTAQVLFLFHVFLNLDGLFFAPGSLHASGHRTAFLRARHRTAHTCEHFVHFSAPMWSFTRQRSILSIPLFYHPPTDVEPDMRAPRPVPIFFNEDVWCSMTAPSSPLLFQKLPEKKFNVPGPIALKPFGFSCF